MEFIRNGFVDELRLIERAGANTSALSVFEKTAFLSGKALAIGALGAGGLYYGLKKNKQIKGMGPDAGRAAVSDYSNRKRYPIHHYKEKVAKPVSWMSRGELQAERKRLQEDYFKSNLPSVAAKGGLLGAVIAGTPVAIAVKKSKKPAVHRVLRRASIPVVALGATVGALGAPGRKRRSVTRDLLEVDSRLKATTSTNLRKRMAKTGSEKSGHWRKLPPHWEGEDKQGRPIKGRTWVDTKPRESKKGPPVPAPELFGREGEFSVYLAPTPNGALVFGIHDDIDEEFSKLVVKGGEDWAYNKSVHKFMTKHEKSGKFSIYAVE